MLNENELKEFSRKALGFAQGYDAEVLLSSGDGALTRFGENVITQNVSKRSAGLSIRLLKGKKMGKASTGNLSDDGIIKCIDTAKAALAVAEDDNERPPLLGPQTYQQKSQFFQSTHELTPEARAEGIVEAVKVCKNVGLKGAGIFSSGGSGMAIANSKGLWAFFPKTSANFSLSAMSDDSSGWAEEGESDISDIDISRLTTTAVKKALEGCDPVAIDPGPWTVVFEPAAVADFIMFLAWEALNGQALVEERSCFTGKIGKKVVGDNITLTDNAFHPLSPGNPFDFEGMPRQKVTMIENGVFKGVVHDRRTAAKFGVESTGHALPQPDPWGPMPLNTIVSPGDSSQEEMIASTEKGLLVTRLHYTNILDPMKMILTGMTRDGLFMIEGGKVTRGVKNMRFTESVLNVLSNVEMLSEKLFKTETFWGGGGTVAPVMKVNDFHFTSRTEN